MLLRSSPIRWNICNRVNATGYILIDYSDLRSLFKKDMKDIICTYVYMSASAHKNVAQALLGLNRKKIPR